MNLPTFSFENSAKLLINIGLVLLASSVYVYCIAIQKQDELLDDEAQNNINSELYNIRSRRFDSLRYWSVKELAKTRQIFNERHIYNDTTNNLAIEIAKLEIKTSAYDDSMVHYQEMAGVSRASTYVISERKRDITFIYGLGVLMFLVAGGRILYNGLKRFSTHDKNLIALAQIEIKLKTLRYEKEKQMHLKDGYIY